MKNIKWFLILLVTVGVFACSKVDDPKTIVLLGEEKYVKEIGDISPVFDSLYQLDVIQQSLTGGVGNFPPCIQGEYKMTPIRMGGTLANVPDSIMLGFFDQHNRVVRFDNRVDVVDTTGNGHSTGCLVDTAYITGSGNSFRTYFNVLDSVLYNGKAYLQTRGIVITGEIDSLGISNVRVVSAIIDFDRGGDNINLDTIIGRWVVFKAENNMAQRLDTLYPCY